jgi:hypothetical protein
MDKRIFRCLNNRCVCRILFQQMNKISRKKKREIKKTIVIDASAEVVFKAITDPNELT